MFSSTRYMVLKHKVDNKSRCVVHCEGRVAARAADAGQAPPDCGERPCSGGAAAPGAG